MNITVLVHMANEDPIVAEMDYMPEKTDQSVIINNPRRRDGKDLHYVMPEVQTLIIPLHRVSFIEIFPSEEEQVVSFIRD